MTIPIPPPQPFPAPLPTAPKPTAAVPNPPTSLTQMAAGSTLKGTVIQQDANSFFQVRTPLGTFAIQTAVAMPQGASLTMQIHSILPQTQMQILSVNGKPPRLGASEQATGKGTAKGAPTGGATAPALSAGRTVTATLMQPPPGTSGGMSAPGTPGMQGALFTQGGVAAVQGPQGTPQGSIQQVPTAVPGQQGIQGQPSPPPGAVQAGATGPPPMPGAPAPLVAGVQVGVQVVSVQPPPPSGDPGPLLPQPGTVGLTVGQTLNAVVTGTTHGGHSIVRTEAGIFFLDAQSPFPEGASLVLKVSGKPVPPPGPLQTFIHESAESMFGSRDWPALREAIAAIHVIDPATAQHLLNNVIPRPDSQLAANVLFFLAALRGGAVRNWLGEGPDRLLQNAKPDLLARLNADFGALGRMSEEPMPVSDWRVTLVPFYNGAGIEQLRMLIRRHGGDEKEGGDQESTRFVIDVDLSKIGHLQLDGLLRQEGKHMDLIVRTESHLPEHMRGDIRGIYQDAAELTGMKGGIIFQAAPPNFVEVTPEEIADDGEHGLVV